MIKKYFSPVFLLFSLFFLLITTYKSEIQWDGETRYLYLKYYFFSAFLIILSIITFYLKNEIKLYFAIIFFSSIFTLYFFESFIKIKSYYSSTKKIKEMNKRDYDMRTIYEALSLAKKNNPEIQYPVFPFVFLKEKNIDIYPLSGRSNTEIIYCNENGFFSEFLTDRFGFNNPDEVWDKDRVEYLVIGDSYAYGNCVNRPDDIVSALRKISKKNSINLGQSGSGPLIEYAILKEFYPQKVKKVIWLYYEGNDIVDLVLELKNSFLRNYISNKNFSQKLTLNQNEVNKIIEKKNKNRSFNQPQPKLITIIKNFLKLTDLRSQIFSTEVEIPKEFEKIFANAKELALENGSELVFVYLPEFSRLKNNFENRNYKKVKSIIESLDIQFIDANKILLASKNPRIFWPEFHSNGHFSKEGYLEIAKIIFSRTK